MTSTDMLTHEGTTQPITEWAQDYGIYPDVIIDRLARGWSAERAITVPMIVAPGQQLTPVHMPGLPIVHERRSVRSRASSPKPNSKRLTHDGRNLTLPQWGAALGISPATIARRMKQGWPIGLVLTAERFSGRPGVARNLGVFEGTGGGSLT